MTSSDANGLAPVNRPSIRRDYAPGKTAEPAETNATTSLTSGKSSRRRARIERTWWVAVVCAMVTFSAFPLANLLLGLPTKDYGLWYQVGLALRHGLDVYPRPETGRLFPFMYPPSAAVMLAWLSMLGPFGSLLTLLLVNSAAWVICVWLSVWLSTGTRAQRHPLVLIVPSLSVVVLVYNIYLLGQPNLVLLALLLGSFACLRIGRPNSARRSPGHRGRHQGVPDFGPRIPGLQADVACLGCDGGRAGRLATDRPASFPHTGPGR